MVFQSKLVSGTSYVLDVSVLNLTSALSVRDFIVTHNGIDRTSSYTKTSATQLTYAGAEVTLGTLVQAYRNTPLTDGETTFISTTTATQLTNALSKLKRRVDELNALVRYQTAIINSSGTGNIGVLPIVDEVFGVNWNGDISNSASRNSVYDAIEPIQTNLTTVTTNLNNLTTTVNGRLRLFANRTTSATIAHNAGFQNFPLNNAIVNLDSYNTSTFTWACPASGIYNVSLNAVVISTGGTTPTKTRVVTGVQINNGTETQVIGTEIDANYAYATGSIVLQLTTGDTIKPRLLLEVTGGSGYTYVISQTASLPSNISINRLA